MIGQAIFRTWRAGGATLLIFASLACAESAQVGGVVSDPAGAVVRDARISLYRANGSIGLNSATDAGGRFLFAEVAAGDYLLEASAPGLTLRETQILHLGAGERRDLTLSLVLSSLTTLVSVTSSGAPQSVDQVSKALDVMSVEDAEQRGIFSISEALRFVPGLQVSTRGSPGTFTTIQTRGLRVTDTAVLIDGFPFRDPTSIQDEASAYLGDLFLVDSSRVEVLRGSGSSLYGSNAVSGALNIITANGEGPLHGDVDVQGGGLGLFRGSARVAGSAWKNRLQYSAGGSNVNVTEGVLDAGAVRDWSGQGSVQLTLRPNMRLGATVWGNTGYLQLNSSPSPAPGAPVMGIIPANSGTFLTSLADPDAGRYSHFVDSLFRFEHDVNARFSYRVGYGIVNTERNNTNGPGGAVTEYDFQPAFNSSDRYSGRIDTVQGRASYLLGSHETLTGGYEFERENYAELATNQNPNPTRQLHTGTNARQQSNAVFAQDEIRFFEGRLEVLLAGRFTQTTLAQPAFIGASVSPYAAVPLPAPPDAYTGDAAVSYFFKRTASKLRAHGGNSFRLPSIYERFGGYFYGGTFFAIGGPNLPPERAVSFDSGFDQYLWREHVKVSASYFYSHLQQVIGYLNFPPGYVDVYGRSGGYYPTAGGIARGVEVSTEVRATRRTSVRGSYVYTNARDRASQYYTGLSVDPVQTPRIAPQVFTAIATQQLGKRIDLAMDFTGSSSYLYPLYGYDASFHYHPFAYRFAGPKLLGLAVGYTLPVNERVSWRFYTRISNTLNQRYFEDGFATPGVWAVAGIRLGF